MNAELIYSIVVALSAILLAGFAVYGWRNRQAPGAKAFAAMMLLAMHLTTTFVMRLWTQNPVLDMFWYHTQYLAYAGIPVVWCVLALEYTGRQAWLTPVRVLGLLLIPLATQLVVWKEFSQGQFFSQVHPWFWVHTIYSYLLLGSGILVLVIMGLRSTGLYRKRIVLLIVGLGCPLAVITLYTFQLLPRTRLSLTPLAFVGTGWAISFSLFRHKMFDVIPVARTALIDTMSDSMIVLDKQHRIVDLNPAAEQIFEQRRSVVLGQPVQQVLSPWHALVEPFHDQRDSQREICLERQGQPVVYDVRMTPLYDHHQQWSGRLVVLRDMTAQKQIEESLRESQRQLEASYQREQERRRLSDTLREAVMIVSSTLEPRRVVGLLLDELQKVVTYHFASVMLVSEQGLTRLVRRNQKGDSYRTMTFPVDAYPLNAEVLQEKRPIVIADVWNDPRWKGSRETGEVRSLLNTPLLVQDRPIGILSIGRSDTVVYTEEDANIVFVFATHVAIALENARLADQTRTTLVDLQDTLDRLQRTQTRLIESEKMAALGKLIANIAHEINTPLGAIQASVTNIATAFTETAGQLPHLLPQFTPEQQRAFWDFVARAVQPKLAQTSREERQIKRTLGAALEAQGVANADDLADTLVDMGIYDDIEALLAHFHGDHVQTVVRAASNLALQRHNRDNIVQAVERMSKILFVLKSYAHHDASGQKIAASVPDGIDVVLTLYQNQLKQGIDVSKQYDDVPPIHCYPDELNQVWTNLLHNAIWAMNGKGTLEITVQHTCEVSETSPVFGILVQITDSGCGIPDAIKDRIFAPFFTTKPAGEGSGLGLDICKKIIDKHQGRIDVESQPGRTAFRVWLPI